MTVAIQTPLVNAVAAGGQTVFPFVFRCDDSTKLQVYKNDIFLAGGNYTVLLNADQIGNPGGTVTLTVGAVAGDVISIERDSDDQQNVTFAAYGRFPASTVELALDKLAMLMQEVWALFSRMFRVTRKNMASIASFDWPAPVLGALLGWVDGGGGRFQLGNYQFTTTGLGALGEPLTDSGDHLHFTSAHATKGPGCLYRNGGRIFSPDDYTQVVGTNQWTVLVALGAGEKLNADYPY